LLRLLPVITLSLKLSFPSCAAWLLLQALSAEEQALLQGMGDEARRISGGGAGAGRAAAGRQQLQG
jgi:hypothetical protein